MKPILFTTDNITAILEGRKTHTRRIIKPPKWADKANKFKLLRESDGVMLLDDENILFWLAQNGVYHKVKLPPPNEQFYVRETWWAWGHWELTGNLTKTGKQRRFVWSGGRKDFQYFQEYPFPGIMGIDNDGNQWYKRPSIYMPKRFSRITLNVTKVWVEWLQDISPKDCFKEGAIGSELITQPIDPVAKFRRLWDSINRARGYGWDKNPPVLVREFEVIVK